MTGKSNNRQPAGRTTAGADPKTQDLEQFRLRPDGEALRTNRGVKIADNQDTLRAAPRRTCRRTPTVWPPVATNRSRMS